MQTLDAIDHVAVSVKSIAESLAWYRDNFACDVLYQDASWAMIQFANIKLALVVKEQHPPHLAFVRTDAAKFGTLEGHRDGTRSVYVNDPAGNAVEFLAKD